MIKVKATYFTDEEKRSLINELKCSFKILKVSKEYNIEGQYRRIHIDLETK